MSPRSRIAAGLAAALVLASVGARADGEGQRYEGTVSAAGSGQVRMTMTDGSILDWPVAADAAVTVGEKKITLPDVKPGQRVSVVVGTDGAVHSLKVTGYSSHDPPGGVPAASTPTVTALTRRDPPGQPPATIEGKLTAIANDHLVVGGSWVPLVSNLQVWQNNKILPDRSALRVGQTVKAYMTNRRADRVEILSDPVTP